MDFKEKIQMDFKQINYKEKNPNGFKGNQF